MTSNLTYYFTGSVLSDADRSFSNTPGSRQILLGDDAVKGWDSPSQGKRETYTRWNGQTTLVSKRTEHQPKPIELNLVVYTNNPLKYSEDLSQMSKAQDIRIAFNHFGRIETMNYGFIQDEIETNYNVNNQRFVMKIPILFADSRRYYGDGNWRW